MRKVLMRLSVPISCKLSASKCSKFGLVFYDVFSLVNGKTTPDVSFIRKPIAHWDIDYFND